MSKCPLYAGAPGFSLPTASLCCPAHGCGALLTESRCEISEMSVQKLQVYLHDHLKTYLGKKKHAELLIPFDHAERAPSHLLHRINTRCSAFIAVTFAVSATSVIKRKTNEVLRSYC
eukprot:2824953-Pleurochrysis_carterae.AAC.2